MDFQGIGSVTINGEKIDNDLSVWLLSKGDNTPTVPLGIPTEKLLEDLKNELLVVPVPQTQSELDSLTQKVALLLPMVKFVDPFMF